MSSGEEVKQRWLNYTEALYKKNSSITCSPMTTESSDFLHEMEPEILESEIRSAIAQLPNRKSPGIDGIPIELAKALGDRGTRMIHEMCNEIWRTREWPQQWKQSVYIPIPKKGDPRECGNNRTIALITHASKVLLKVMQRRIEPYMQRELAAEQAGFRKGRGTRDQIANLRWILEKGREYNKHIYMCFIDYSKAFDCVDHTLLWRALEDMGVPKHLIVLLRNLYCNQEATVRTEAGDTEWFKIGKGVRQGCILSPYLFNLYTETIMRRAEMDSDNEGVRVGGRCINNLRYADDTTLIAESLNGLKNLISTIKAKSAEFGLFLNIKKTKIMTTDAVTDFEVEWDRLEVVKDFVLLGSQVNEDARSRPEIWRRIALGRAAMGNLRHIMLDKTLAISVKVKIIQTMVFPIVTYGSESWTVMKEDRRKIDAFELWCWRRACRVKWTDKVTNKSILTWVAPYNKLSLDARILKLKMSYFGHVMRRNGMEKDIMLGKVGGRRRRGRQRMRWMEGILTETGNGLKELRELVESRHEWRAFIHRVTKSRERLNG